MELLVSTHSAVHNSFMQGFTFLCRSDIYCGDVLFLLYIKKIFVKWYTKPCMQYLAHSKSRTDSVSKYIKSCYSWIVVFKKTLITESTISSDIVSEPSDSISYSRNEWKKIKMSTSPLLLSIFHLKMFS